MAVEQSGDEGASPAGGGTATGDRTAGGAAAKDAAAGKKAAGDAGAGRAAPGRAAAGGAAHAAGGDEATAKPELDDMKRKFREALERKREQHTHANAEGAQGTGKVNSTHGPASSRRSFRRKSGG